MTPHSLVGRETELKALTASLDALGAGESATVMLSGEPGIGKTALLAETLRQSRERGYMTLDGRAVEVEGDLPFGVFADALERELSELSLDNRDLIDEDDLALLAVVFPSLAGTAQRRPGTPDPDERHRLLQTIQALLELLAGDGPLVLALDDLHWADPASIDLVCRLLHRRLEKPLLLIIASRPAQSEPRLRAAFDEAGRHDGHVSQIVLSPLSDFDAKMLLGTEIAPQLRETIYRESGGNPLFLEQLATAARLGSLPTEQETGPTELGVPAAVDAAIRSELGHLSSPTRTFLEGASLLREPFEPDLAAETAGVTREEGLIALDELLEADVVRPADSPRGFRFRHPIIRRAVYEASGAGWRLAAHGRAASALEARGASPSARAPHIEKSARSGDAAAVAVLTQAGQQTAVRAPASAARWFGGALRLLPKREDTVDLRLTLLINRANASGTAGHIEESREALESFLALSKSSELRVRAAIFAAILDELMGKHAEGRRLLLNELDRLSNPRGREAADLKRELAFTFFLDADWQATYDWAQQALDCECEGIVRVGALAVLGLGKLGLGDADGMSRSVLEATDLFDRLEDSEVAAQYPGIGIWLGWAECCAERFDDAIRHLERSVAILHSNGQRHLTVGLLTVQGQALALRGDGTRLRAVTEMATEAALLSSSDLYLSWLMSMKALIGIWDGDLHAAVRYGERAAGAASTANSPQSEIARAGLAEALLEIGEPTRCRDLLQTAAGEPKPPPLPLYEAFCYELLVRAEISLGNVDRAGDLAERVTEMAQSLGLKVPMAQARRARALVLLERGEARAAAAEAAAAREAAEEVHATYEAALSRLLEGRAHAVAGDKDLAIAVLEAAHAQFVDSGAFRYGDEAAGHLRKLGRVVPRTAGARRSDPISLDLTKREAEVMELVAIGKTNRQVAEKLFLSVRTVDRHVSRIFEKLDVNSRAAASSVFERARARSGQFRLVEPPHPGGATG